MYLVSFNVKSKTNDNFSVWSKVENSLETINLGKNTGIKRFIQTTSANTSGKSFIIGMSNGGDEVGSCTTVIDEVMYIDLTAMFGAGNEPSTVAEFEAQYPEDYYPYDAGSLQSVNIESITSAGSTREIPASTYFPNGMRGAGTAHDALTKSSAVTRIGAVDLGTLNWIYRRDNGVFYVTLSDKRPYVSTTSQAKLKSALYEFGGATGVSATDLPDMTIYNRASSDNQIIIRNTSYTDVDAFKTAMSGVMLQYELAAPTTQTIDPPLNLTYPVEQGGTESIIVPTGSTSAAPTFVTLYAYDADGIIDKTQGIIAQVENGVASTNYAVNSYIVMRGTLYRVTSAIATGEVITPGTNCTATTVMAEIVRLTA